MFAASKTFFQRVARSAVRNGASKMTMTTAAPKSNNASAICAVGYCTVKIDDLGCRRSYVGFLCWLSDF